MDIDSLVSYRACSANDSSNKHLWIKGASLFIPQINKLLQHTNYNQNIIDINNFNIESNNYNKLGEILDKHGSDKSTGNNYHILYSYVFNKIGINSYSNILEIGLGTNNPNLVSSMGINGKPGASIYGFKEYLQNSNIYGADIDKDILFNCDRIKTCYVDQLNIESFDNIINTFGKIKYDVIIDDGLHSIGANFNTLLFALDNIKKNGWIIIEDIHMIDNYKSIDYMLKNNNNKFMTYIIKANSAYLYVVHKLKN